MDESIKISVIIKTFNEQSGIAHTIHSVRDNLTHYCHEIIVADSLSTDNTQAIAIENGAKVVTLVNEEERCCGVGHQLGFLHAKGDFLLLMDGDMELAAGFIERGIAFLDTHRDYAGVAGMVEMDEATSYEFKSRKQRLHKIYPLGDTSHLGGGGLYRKSAIEKIGYLTNRNLHAYEEAELGMRLKHAGYKLHRLATPYFFHTSYDMSSTELIIYRWRSGYLFASGELLRSAWRQPHFGDALYTVKNESIFTVYLLSLLVFALTLDAKIFSIALLPLLTFFAVKALKNRSVKDALQSIVNLTLFSAGLIRGLGCRVKDPKQEPEHSVIRGNR